MAAGTALESLLFQHRAPEAFHRRAVKGDHLGRKHALNLVLWPESYRRTQADNFFAALAFGSAAPSQCQNDCATLYMSSMLNSSVFEAPQALKCAGHGLKDEFSAVVARSVRLLFFILVSHFLSARAGARVQLICLTGRALPACVVCAAATRSLML